VTAEAGLNRVESEAEVKPASGSTFKASLPSGQLTLGATRAAAADGELIGDGVTFILSQDDPFAPQGRREVARSAAAAPSFILPPGTYYVTARTATAEAREQLAIGDGDTVTRVLPLAMARIRLGATLGRQPLAEGQPVAYRVVRLDSPQHEVARTIAGEPELDLSAGRYRIEASLPDSNVLTAVEINLSAGQAQKVTLHLDAGTVTLRGAGSEAATAGGIYWEVRDSQQRPVLRSIRPQPTVLLAPGHYTVIADTSSGLLGNSIEVKPNEHSTYDLSAR
jgi:Ca-activated chloride channel family protein